MGHAGRVLRARYKVSPGFTDVRYLTNSLRSYIHGLTDKFKGKFMLDMVGGIVEDYEYLWDGYYFATS